VVTATVVRGQRKSPLARSGLTWLSIDFLLSRSAPPPPSGGVVG
jgi:hypothetical protein